LAARSNVSCGAPCCPCPACVPSGKKRRDTVRLNVVIDDELMKQALRLGGFRTKKAAIEAGLRLLIQLSSQRKLRSLRGKIKWEGDLEAMRKDG